MLELLLVVAFTLHLVAVNVAAAGPLFSVAVEWRGTRCGDSAAIAIARRVAALSLTCFVAGIAIGGALLAILWHSEPSYWSALRRVPTYRWWFFGGELLFYLVCMIPYLTLWNRTGERRWWHRLLAIFAATNVLYHFPPLFTMVSLMSTRAELADAALDRSLYVKLFSDAESLARVAHHWLSSLATAGIALMLLASPRREGAAPTEQDAARSRVSTFAARVALLATLLQLPAGLWLLLESPASAQSRLLGGEATSTVLFVAALLSIVLLLQQLATAALGDSSPKAARNCVSLLLLVLLLMSGVLHRTRFQAGAATTLLPANHSATVLLSDRVAGR